MSYATAIAIHKTGGPRRQLPYKDLVARSEHLWGLYIGPAQASVALATVDRVLASDTPTAAAMWHEAKAHGATLAGFVLRAEEALKQGEPR